MNGQVKEMSSLQPGKAQLEAPGAGQSDLMYGKSVKLFPFRRLEKTSKTDSLRASGAVGF